MQRVRQKFDSNEDEEELLRLQEEFLTTKQRPAATVVRRPQPPVASQPIRDVISLDAPPDLEDVPAAAPKPKGKGKSLFATRRELEERENAAAAMEAGDVGDTQGPAVKRVVDFDSHFGNVMGGVTEKDVVKLDFTIGGGGTWRHIPPPTGFPEPVHRSVFQRMHMQKKQEESISKEAPSRPTPGTAPLYHEIHEENVKKLSEMSEADINEARAQLLHSLDPNLLEKLMQRKPVTERGPNEDAKVDVNFHSSRSSHHGEERHVHFQDDAVEIIGESFGGDIGEGVVVDTDLAVDGIKEDGPLLRHPPITTQEESIDVDGPDADADAQEDDDPLVMKAKYYADVPAEHDKLEWMGIKLPHSNPSTPSQPQFAHSDLHPVAHLRFDFVGTILDQAAAVPVHKGLHHHGEDPDLAGYTLPELFHLMRSQVPSQRVIALNTVARVLAKVGRGEYPQRQGTEIATYLTSDKTRAVAYLRSALDDRNVAVVVAAVGALAAWLVEGDEEEREGEEGLGGGWEWRWREKGDVVDRGYEGVWMTPRSLNGGKVQAGGGVTKKFGLDIVDQKKIDEDNNDDDDDGESGSKAEDYADDTIEAHAKLAQKDLIAALLRMQILPRLRYLLENLAGSEDGNLDHWTLGLVVCILLRIVRGSKAACDELVAKSPRLIELVWKWGVVGAQWPIVEEREGEMDGEGSKLHADRRKTKRTEKKWPSVVVVRFLRTLTQSSRDVARDVCVGKGLADDLLRFVIMSPSSMPAGPARSRAYALQVEVLRTYRTLAAYGLFCHVLADIFVAVPGWLADAEAGYEHDEDAGWIARRTVAVMGLLEVYAHAAADMHRMEPEHDICWAQPVSYVGSVVGAVGGWIEGMQGAESSLRVAVLASALGYVGAWCRYLDANPPPGGETEVIGIWEMLRGAFHEDVLNRIVRAVEDMEAEPLMDTSTWELENLAGAYHPEVRRMMERRADEAVLVDLLLRMMQVAGAFGRLPIKAVENEAKGVVTSDAIMKALQVLQRRGASPMRYWTSILDRPKNHLLWTWANATKTLGLVDVPSFPRNMWIRTATELMTRLQPGDEWLVKWLLDNVVLDEKVVGEWFLQLFPGQRPALPLGALKDILELFYRAVVGSDGQIAHSKGLCMHDGRDVGSLMADYSPVPKKAFVTGLPLSPSWVFTPIDELYNADHSEVLRELPDGYQAKEEEIVVSTLEVAKVLCNHVGEGLALAALDPAAVTVALMKVFMIGEKNKDDGGWGGAGEEVFRDQRVDRLVAWWLDRYSAGNVGATSLESSATPLEPSANPLLPLESAWLASSRYTRTTTTPFYQFYQDFSAQYAAVSFGGTSFARLLLPVLSTSYPSDYKHLIWNDLFDVLQTIRLDVEDVPCVEPGGRGVAAFLYPHETNTAVLRFYLRAVLEGKARKEGRQGVGKGALYWIAVHHLSELCFEGAGTSTMVGSIAREVAVMMCSRGSNEVVGDWVRYQGVVEGNIVMPPECYGVARRDAEEVRRRMRVLMGLIGEGGKFDRLVDKVKDVLDL
ncbi:hypothetical protein BC938DRAFT_483001 [Jimgerdemannia flammicorona]|uniref:RNA polymerase II-associated protein 1 C-terminal domain-containing protein n=1 Tax=Jimgerdemannia flammicorona TaxID=994334 RepID=A0A433QCS1_9FUNG|nr:hypothetical protein BC938DRAFT_483001 [Jimgerdemannia flammicorona]